MNILITKVPNPNIRYFEASINLIEIFKDIKGVFEIKTINYKIRVQKESRTLWEVIEKKLELKVKDLKITYKNIKEIELQENFKESFEELNKDLEELIYSIRD